MTETSWKDRIERGRDIVQGRTADLSASARAAAEGAGARIGEVYGQARGQATAAIGQTTAATRTRAARLAEVGAARAGSLGHDARELGGEALRRSRDTLDKATLASRGLIAERPLTAVVIGIGAGIILGALANRLARTRADIPADEASEEDDWAQ